MLPATPAHARSITGVAKELLASLSGGSEFGTATSAVIVVIDGLGALQLRAHAAHARRLSALMNRKDVALSVFPATTAAALTSLMTGAEPGTHGLVGYSVQDPATHRVVNQLSGWEGLDPVTWQRSETIFERATAAGFGAFAVGPGEYAGSAFSAAMLRGATYVPSDDLSTRLARALSVAEENPGTIVYCYIPDVDKAGHKFGVDSDQWIAALEEVDALFARPIPRDVGVIVTADHGMIDVPAHRHIVIESGDPRREGVRNLGGEPRMVHIYAEDGADPEAIAHRWREHAGSSADIVTRDEAIAAGLFREVADEVRPRIGDVLAIARGTWAYYDGEADPRARGMIGQHGALTPEETIVPLIRAGAFAR